MPSVRKLSLRWEITIAVFLITFVSGIVSVGISNYLLYLREKDDYDFAVAHPSLYPNPPSPPHFGYSEFYLGAFPVLHPATSSQPPGDDIKRFDVERAGITVRIFIWKMSAGVFFSLFVGFAFWLRFSKSFNSLISTARAMTEGNYLQKPTLRGPGELTELAVTLDTLGARISYQMRELQHEGLARRQFMADIAHEFRTPLTTLSTMAGALRDGLANDPERHRRAVDSISRTADRLLRLVSDLLELSLLDLKELPLHSQKLDLGELVSSCIENRQDQALSQRSKLLLVVSSEGPVSVVADPDRVAQCLDNLLDNALTYGGPGSSVSVEVVELDRPRIVVRDTGPGIPAEKLPFVTEPFYQVSAARSPGDQHSGLGLRVVKSLMEAQGGQLLIESVFGEGTTAILEFGQTNKGQARDKNVTKSR
jgi:signal transduction histidine kinase